MKKIGMCSICICLVLQLCACGQRVPTWQAQYDLGIKYLDEGNYEEAILAFTAAIEIDPKQAGAYVGRGNAQVNLAELSSEKDATSDNYKGAVTDYLAALGLDKLIVAVYEKLANVYLALGDIDAAKAILQQGYDITSDEQLKDYWDEISNNAEISTSDELAQGECIKSFLSDGGNIEYRFYCVDGIPQPIEITEVEQQSPDGRVTTIMDTIMAYGRTIDAEGVWSEWEPVPHYWAALFCTNCGEIGNGKMPDWYKYPFSHTWSGEWKGGMLNIYSVSKESN